MNSVTIARLIWLWATSRPSLPELPARPALPPTAPARPLRMLQPGGVKSDKMYSILVTLVLVIVTHTELMLPGVYLEVEEEQQQERGDAINHEVAVGEVILEWSKLEMLIFIFIQSWRTPSIFYKLIGRGKFLIQSF